MKTFKDIKSDLNSICELFKLGSLIGYKTKNHSAEGYKVANFETTNGNFEYIFKSYFKLQK